MVKKKRLWFSKETFILGFLLLGVMSVGFFVRYDNVGVVSQGSVAVDDEVIGFGVEDDADLGVYDNSFGSGLESVVLSPLSNVDDFEDFKRQVNLQLEAYS